MSELPAVPASRARDAGGKFGPAQRLENLWRQGHRPDVSDFLSKLETLTPSQVVAVMCVDQHQRWQQGERWNPPQSKTLAESPRARGPRKAFQTSY